MKIVNAVDLNFVKDSTVTIGTFDGVHIGHRKIIERLVGVAEDHDEQAVVLTFFPHPRMVLQKDSNIKLLNTIEEKSQLLKQLGVHRLVVQEFTQDFSRLTAFEFVRDILVSRLRTKHIIIGYDHHFGRNRAANIDDLRDFGTAFGFEVMEIDAQEINDVAVSSTKIRNALAEGDLQTANAYLGYPYMLNGTIITGKGLGKELGYPTANLKLDQSYKLIPKNGAYVIKTEIDNQLVYGMMNIGYNPTVEHSNEKRIEIHLLDFDANLYGRPLTIQMIQRLRDEVKFETLSDLRDQLGKDESQARDIVKSYDQ